MAQYKSIPAVAVVISEQISDNYYQVKLDIKQMIEREVNILKEHSEEDK